MTHAYEPMLSGKWTEAISTAEVTTHNNNNKRNINLATEKPREHPAPPPTSPTSPKVTKFCCCPQKRRFHLRQSPPKKSTLHARNIFIDNDFNYIDEVENISGNGSYIKTNNDESDDNNKRSTKRPAPIYRQLSFADHQRELRVDKELKKLQSTKINNNNNDYDEINVDTTNDSNRYECINCGTGNCNTAELMNHKNCSRNNNSINQWRRQYESAFNENSKKQQTNYNNICIDDENLIQTSTATHDTQSVDCTDASITTTTIQRHSCNETFNKECSIKNNNDSNNLNNCEHEGLNLTLANNNNKYKSLAKENILQNKMTIATTMNVANRKRGSECGSTPATTTEMATTSSHTPSSPTTITTVIKTTMLKRSPSNEAASPPSTPTATTTTVATDSNEIVATCKEILNGDNKVTANASQMFDGKGNNCLRESTRTVRERIEALKANNGK